MNNAVFSFCYGERNRIPIDREYEPDETNQAHIKEVPGEDFSKQ